MNSAPFRLFPAITIFLAVLVTQTHCLSAVVSRDELIQKILAGDEQAILELGNLGDKSAVPFLQTLLGRPNKSYGSAACYAQMALAKLGEKQQQDEIVNELSSEDPSLQDDAFRKLAYVGGSLAVKTVALFLTDTKYDSWREMKQEPVPDGQKHMDVVGFEPLSWMAVRVLAEILPDPVTTPGRTPTKESVQKWREWWEANKSKYQ
jgi:hypothetical protein